MKTVLKKLSSLIILSCLVASLIPSLSYGDTATITDGQRLLHKKPVHSSAARSHSTGEVCLSCIGHEQK